MLLLKRRRKNNLIFSVKSGQKKKEGKQGLTSEDILYIRFVQCPSTISNIRVDIVDSTISNAINQLVKIRTGLNMNKGVQKSI